ncbi:Vegetative incompatibility protein HET-E-1 [Ceratobasidium sp. AG-Ba]|nr:Vegetative incompatibility protein HET-E-1 [Ceratobasidium sp. AG-Ba]
MSYAATQMHSGSATNTDQDFLVSSWPGLESLQRALSEVIGPFEPLKSAISKIAYCMESESTAGKEHTGVMMVLDELLQDLSIHFEGPNPPSMTPAIEILAWSIKKEAEKIAEQQRDTSLNRLLGASKRLDEVDACYRRIQSMLERLKVKPCSHPQCSPKLTPVKLNADLSIWRVVDEHSMDKRLDRLPYSPSAKYDSAASETVRRNSCTENTRVDLLQGLWNWATDHASEKIYWLNGMAGTGKTTIAYSLCERLKYDKRLAASFFCSQRLSDCRDVSRIIPSISYQLSCLSAPFRYALSKVLEYNTDAYNQRLARQLEDLLVNPLIGGGSAVNLGSSIPGDLVVVIDALDECEEKEAVGQMIHVLLLHARDLPLKFFISSRPSAQIMDQMRGNHGAHVKTEMRLHELDHSIVQADVRTYLKTHLASQVQLSEDSLEALVDRSGVLFIYAAMIVRYVSSNNFSRGQKRLTEVLDMTNNLVRHHDKGMDSLYTAILQMALEDLSMTESERKEMKLVLDTVVCAVEPVAVDQIAGVLRLDSEESVHAALRPLFSVLQVSDATGEVTTLHQSFSDYLFDEHRAGSFYCDKDSHHAYLAHLCFEHINTQTPAFNICRLESSYLLDKDVMDIYVKIPEAISRGLSYACRYWAGHLVRATMSECLMQMLWQFLSRRFLLWMEVISLEQHTGISLKALDECQKWLLSIKDMQDIEPITELFLDAHNPISKHYREGRPYMGPEASLPLTWGESSLPSTTPGQLQFQYNIEHIPNKHAGTIDSIAFSPDDAHIATGSMDKTIRIWNLHTGQLVLGPLAGHKAGVSSIVYSPDGEYIVSGSWDRTIRIWEAGTGQKVGRSLCGHKDGIQCVAHSPNGKCVASGALDQTIRIWDIEAKPLNAKLPIIHSGFAVCIAYLPDGNHIASCTWDGTIYAWDANSGQLVNKFLLGCSGSVAFMRTSLSGLEVASVSEKGDLDIWDVHAVSTSEELQHNTAEALGSITYSPDGDFITCNYYSGKVSIQDAYCTRSVEIPFHDVFCLTAPVAVSADMAYVAVANSFTIRVWNGNFDHTPQLTPPDNTEITQSNICPQESTELPPRGRMKSCEVERMLATKNHLSTYRGEAANFNLDLSHPVAQDINQPNDQPHICSSCCRRYGTHTVWCLREDGWVITEDEKLLIWIPDDFRHGLLYPQNTHMISNNLGTLRLHLHESQIGNQWAKHFESLLSSGVKHTV